MRTRDGWRGGAALAVTALVAACGPAGDDVGFDTPQVAALDEPQLREHFTSGTTPLAGTLRALANGCLVAVIDGVDHVVFWPDGTVAEDTGEPAGRYAVTLPDGRMLHADTTGGERFSAVGEVAASGGVIAVDPDHPDGDFAGSYLGFCGVDAPPVMFPDAATFDVG
ncbi:hypothetical protein ACFQ8E_15635 [Isoptericola sp. NPDC056573]|uniref:hypothetical protein n=1 Tax=Isoptericola sp. NPDC056573 TaxID=3345868 RepID=UPI0036BC986B